MKYFLILILLTSCASKTRIKVNDELVKIYIEDRFRGRGSILYEDTKIMFSKTKIVLKKENCQEKEVYLVRNEKMNYLALFGSIIIFPSLWIFGYDDEHVFDYSCQN